MEIFQQIVILVVVGGGALLALTIVLFVLYFVVPKIWIILLGAGGGYFLWQEVDHDVGVAFGVICLLGQFAWWIYFRKPDPMEEMMANNKTQYEEMDYLPGYFDL